MVKQKKTQRRINPIPALQGNAVELAGIQGNLRLQ